MAEHHSSEGGEHTGERHASEGGERLREVIRDAFTITLGAASWAFEQGDRMIDTWLHQGHISREEGRRRFDEFASRTRHVGEDLGRRVQGSVASARASMATREQVANLERQVAELTRQVESLKGSASPSGPAVTRERPHP
jgi:polyhydroxyalkanoate synthesis regulator phasin